jgi:hypothetical protein
MNRIGLLGSFSLAGMLLSAGCLGVPPETSETQENVSIIHRPPPLPIYPDYGTVLTGTTCNLPVPAAFDLEGWDGQSLWPAGTTGYVMWFYAFVTPPTQQNPNPDLNYNRVEYFGVSSDFSSIVWHAFGGGLETYLQLSNMSGSLKTCTFGPDVIPNGNLPPNAPPRNPPQPPDVPDGAPRYCPAELIEQDAQLEQCLPTWVPPIHLLH